MSSKKYFTPLNPAKPVQSNLTGFTPEEAKAIGEKIGIDFDKARLDLEDFRYGMDVELEHGKKFDLTNVTGDDPIVTGKIAWAHLREFPDYYQRLKKMEEEAEKYWEERRS